MYDLLLLLYSGKIICQAFFQKKDKNSHAGFVAMFGECARLQREICIIPRTVGILGNLGVLVIARLSIVSIVSIVSIQFAENLVSCFTDAITRNDRF